MEGWDAEAVRWEKRDVEAGSGEAEDEAGCREMDRSRAVALRLDNCGGLIGWRAMKENV